MLFASPCLSLEKQKTTVLQECQILTLYTDIKRRVGWMGSSLKRRVNEFDRKIASEGRNVTLVIDKFPAHLLCFLSVPHGPVASLTTTKSVYTLYISQINISINKVRLLIVLKVHRNSSQSSS